MAQLSWPQRTALALGALLVTWALVDLAAGRPPLAVLHGATGLAMAATAFRRPLTRLVGTLMGVVFLVVFAYGVGDQGGPLDTGFAGGAAHLLLGFASVAIAESCVWCERSSTPRRLPHPSDGYRSQ
ncbi:hypothetical protein [Saccharothrix obliqua]|uniref:hypothetical protein n=1 Tax=Saccharothrix obliqua TaxID=2861747 RepID=UPI001C5D7907|nr:hypothetical protein [Saccharothrix obliqua]MBW4721133.1 hypothetical protein [Saccharothrix obliqua]